MLYNPLHKSIPLTLSFCLDYTRSSVLMNKWIMVPMTAGRDKVTNMPAQKDLMRAKPPKMDPSSLLCHACLEHCQLNPAGNCASFVYLHLGYRTDLVWFFFSVPMQGQNGQFVLFFLAWVIWLALLLCRQNKSCNEKKSFTLKMSAFLM